ncbi:MAG: hypothetical protein WBA51_14940 [Erythrobacter sp.]
MASKLDKERDAIRADEKRLAERNKKLLDRELQARVLAFSKSPLGKLEQDRLEALLGRVKALGIDEVEKRLSGVTGGGSPSVED